MEEWEKATDAQIRFAKEISDELIIPLPEQESKKLYGEFIAENCSMYYRRKKKDRFFDRLARDRGEG